MPGAPHARGRGGLRRADRADLSALAAQLDRVLLAPADALSMHVHGGRKESAVLVPLFADGDGGVHAVFTERRRDLRRHAGEISFPGGRREEGEELVWTALREAHEEIGLAPDAVVLAGALEPVGTFVTNYAIYPFVGVIEAGMEWVLGEAEVAQVLEVPLQALRDGEGERRLVRKGIAFRTTAYQVGPHLIWGATARILADLLRRLSPENRPPGDSPR